MSNRGICILFLAVFCSCKFEKDKTVQNKTPIAIEVWYGDVQDFGTIGLPQKRINILGNARAKAGIAALLYSLNGELKIYVEN